MNIIKNQHMAQFDDPVEALQKALRDLPDPSGSSGWTRDDFRQWLSISGMSTRKAAEALGMSRRQIAYMVSGEKPVLQRTALACIGVLVRQVMSRKT